jgi:ABC-2 type transport system permease protein
VNWRAIGAIIRKDLLVVRRSKPVLVALLVLPLVFLVIFPLGITLAARSEAAASEMIQEFGPFVEQMPSSMRAIVDAQETDGGKLIVLGTMFLLAPMYLLVPMLVSAIFAADSFAGERDRKTLEALLYTPTTDRELMIAKLLGAWLPAVAVGIGGFVAYAVVVNVGAWPVIGEIFFPNLMWLVLAFWVGPGLAGLGIGTMVFVSSRVRGFYEAYQLGGLVVLPVIALLVAQLAGVIYFSTWLVTLLGVVIWAITAGLVTIAARTLRRSELVARV